MPLRVVRLKDALVQTAHSGSIQPCAAVSETVLVDSAVGGDEGHNQVDKMIQTVQEAQKKLTHMLSVPELTVSACVSIVSVCKTDCECVCLLCCVCVYCERVC